MLQQSEIGFWVYLMTEGRKTLSEESKNRVNNSINYGGVFISLSEWSNLFNMVKYWILKLEF